MNQKEQEQLYIAFKHIEAAMKILSKYKLKKTKKSKRKGGAIYTEADLGEVVKLDDGIEYIEDKDKKGYPLEDIITNEYIPKNKAILVNELIYDVDSIYTWITSQQSAKKIDGYYKKDIQPNIITKIKQLYNKIHNKTSTNEVYSIDLIDSNGTELIHYITTENKYKLMVLSKPYNQRGAYYPFETGYITINSKIYQELTKNDSLKKLYVKYYNNIKDSIEKSTFNLPDKITEDQIETIRLDILPSKYVDYWMR